MKSSTISILLLAVLAVTTASADEKYLSELENDILKEINLARTNPQKYAKILAETQADYSENFRSRANKAPIETKEGWDAVQEAIQFLNKAKPLPPVTASQGMSLAARELADRQSKIGDTGHEKGDRAPWNRLKRYGKWNGLVGENLIYNFTSARDVVSGWIVDDSVSDRGHRSNLFEPRFLVVGIAAGEHPEFHSMAVLVLASTFMEN